MAVCHDAVNEGVLCDILHCEWNFGIHCWQYAQVEMIYPMQDQMPFARLVAIWGHSKPTDKMCKKGGEEKRPAILS